MPPIRRKTSMTNASSFSLFVVCNSSTSTVVAIGGTSFDRRPRAQVELELAVERVRDAEQRVEPRGAPPGFEPGDRGLRRPGRRGQLARRDPPPRPLERDAAAHRAIDVSELVSSPQCHSIAAIIAPML